ncbi:MAG TPA: hypothetical protein DDW27_21580 [Bacteroidales bacterium]|nr:hypothetical protein [Bacteroidales bacterium]
MLLTLIIITASCRDTKTADQSITINNGKISIGFDRKTGSLTTFKDIVNSFEWLDENVPDGSPWELEFNKEGGNEVIDISSSGKFRYSKTDASTLILRWMKFKDPENKKLEVEARITLDKDKALSYWNITVSIPEGRQVKQVIYPRIAGLREAGAEYLAVPQWMGQITKNPRANLSAIKSNIKKYEFTYPGLSLQCLALYDPDKYGFYAACNDSTTYIKNFSFTLDTLNTLIYKMHNLPSVDPSLKSYSTPYSGVIGSFKGDWITAAEIYREWGTQQRWARESRFANDLTPAWVESTALWVWNRSKSGNVLLPAADIKQRLGLPVNVFWHWWHGCSYDDGFPEYVPPREGKKSFISAVSAANDKGIRAIVYMNQRLWGTTTESWEKENASVYAVKNPDGKINTHVYNIFSNKGTASMCLGTQFWKDKYASLCDSAVNTYKANGVYMDQACLALQCYDPEHAHPVGPGNYWIQNFGMLTDQIRSKISSDKEIILAGEGGGEAWIPHLDLFLTLAVSKERYAGLNQWETIPFFQAVYHQYAITYGNYSSLLVPPYDELWPKEYAPKKPLEMLDKKFNKQFLMEQARSFVWGMQPTIANYQSFLARDRKNEIDYLMELSRVRNKALKYLLYGKFMKSPDFESPEEEFDISRLSIYAGKTGNSVTTFRGTFPLIYSCTWQAEDMDLGIALASIGDKPVEIKFSFNADEYDLPQSGRIFVIDDTGKRELAKYSDKKVLVDLTLKSKGICILEVTSEN